jgi:hypothetical protein
VQLIRDNRLRWELEWNCRTCGTVSDDGDWGPAPADLREELLAQHGVHRLRLDGGESGGVSVLSIFREVFGASLGDAQAAASRLRRAGHDGTLVEAELLRDRLREHGIHSAITRAGDDGTDATSEDG